MQGLMQRDSIGENEGMLFIFKKEEQRFFWMKNTSISLDILYINSSLEIVSIVKSATPFSEEFIPSTFPAKYVLEVNAGFTTKNNIDVGSTIRKRKIDVEISQ